MRVLHIKKKIKQSLNYKSCLQNVYIMSPFFSHQPCELGFCNNNIMMVRDKSSLSLPVILTHIVSPVSWGLCRFPPASCAVLSLGHSRSTIFYDQLLCFCKYYPFQILWKNQNKSQNCADSFHHSNSMAFFCIYLRVLLSNMILSDCSSNIIH